MTRERPGARGWMRAAALLAIAAPLLVPLGTPGLVNPDEGRFAEIAREMVATGDWVVPRLNGVPHWSKPPLAYWATGASLRVFGMTERAARLPSAVAATATLLATWFLARRMGDARVATIAVISLATMFEFHMLARIVTTDMIQTAFISWAAALFWAGRNAVDRPGGGPFGRAVNGIAPGSPASRAWLRYGAFACLGASFVDKGPVALGVFLSAALAFRILKPGVTLVSLRQLAAGLGIVLAIGLPWFVVVSRLHPDLFEFFLGREVKDRYFSEVHGRAQGPWYFPVVLLLGTLPWTAPLVAAIAQATFGLRRPRAAASDAGAFLASWIAGPFLLFSFSGSKLAAYLLPLLPFCALAVARWVSAAEDRDVAARPRVTLAILAATPALMAIAAAITAATTLGAPPAAWAIAAVIVTTASALLVRAVASNRGVLGPGSAAVLAGLLALGWESSVPLFADEASLDLGSHASLRWLRDALPAGSVRGEEIGGEIRPPEDGVTAATRANVVIYRLKVNSLPFYLFGTRPEYVPVFGQPQGWEIESDQSRARPATLGDLVALLARDERVHVVTRRKSLSEIEAAFGRPLALLATHGRGQDAVALCANR